MANDVFQGAYAANMHEAEDRQPLPPGQGSRSSSQAPDDTQKTPDNSSAAAETMAIHNVLGNIVLQLNSISDRLGDLKNARATSPADAGQVM